MRIPVHSRKATQLAPIQARTWISLTLALLLAGCGGSSNDAGTAAQSTTPTTPVSVPLTPLEPAVTPNTVVASSSELAELQVYAGQSRNVTLVFRTSDGGSATDLALAAPAAGFPTGWSISGSALCAQVEANGQCQVALTYAPAAAAPSSSITLPYSYRNNKGDASTGSVAVPFRALAVNAAVAKVDPAGAIRGLVGKASAVTLSFTTNDGSAATGLHLDDNLSALPAGWTSASTGLDCASFGAGSSCQLALSYAPATPTPASALAISYRYRDSSGKQQTGTTSIAYSAVGPNTVNATASPAGVVRARSGSSQQVALTFTPSDSSAASNLRLTTSVAALPPEWTITQSTLPCAQVGADGACTLTLRYKPGANQPAGKLDLDYAYTDAVGRELAGKTSIAYASRDFQVYVGDYGIAKSGSLAGRVRQCERDSAGKLVNCIQVDGTFPSYGANNVVVYGARAYLGIYGNPALYPDMVDRPVITCTIADDNALVGCKDSGPVFDQLTNLEINRLGALVLAVPSTGPRIPHLTRCGLDSDGTLDSNACHNFDSKFFDSTILTAMTSANDMIYVSGSNFSTAQNLYSCALVDDGLKCSTFALGAPDQIVQRMSRGQAGDQAYLYLATASRTDPQKVPGTVAKCALDADGLVLACYPVPLPPGLQQAELTRISDIKIVGLTAYLVTGQTDDSRNVYQCPIEQKTGDLAACVSNGTIAGLATSSIAVR
jgi:hypothetical protein